VPDLMWRELAQVVPVAPGARTVLEGLENNEGLWREAHTEVYICRVKVVKPGVRAKKLGDSPPLPSGGARAQGASIKAAAPADARQESTGAASGRPESRGSRTESGGGSVGDPPPLESAALRSVDDYRIPGRASVPSTRTALSSRVADRAASGRWCNLGRLDAVVRTQRGHTRAPDDDGHVPVLLGVAPCSEIFLIFVGLE